MVMAKRREERRGEERRGEERRGEERRGEERREEKRREGCLRLLIFLVMLITERFNILSNWTASQIITAEPQKLRISLLKKIIRLCYILKYVKLQRGNATRNTGTRKTKSGKGKGFPDTRR
jgi:hypothetical protein